MHFLKLYLGATTSGSLVASLPLSLSSYGALILQNPKNYGNNLIRDPAATERGTVAGQIGTQDDPPAHEAPDPDDGNDDDEDLIPGDLLEGDSDSGGESDTGNDAASVANGLLGGGAGSAALNNRTSGSTAVFCSLFACASAAQSDGKVSTSTTGARIHATGPLVSLKGPLVVINVSRTSVSKTSG